VRSSALIETARTSGAAPVHPGLEGSKKLVRSMSGWNWVTINGPHDAMITHPKEMADLLIRIANS
jgi:hypothetical protein